MTPSRRDLKSEDTAAQVRDLAFARTGSLIHDIARMGRQLYDQQARPLNITRAQWSALYHLAQQRGAPLNQRALARILELGFPATGDLIHRLERSGFVERVVEPNDRRSKKAVLAQRGRELLSDMRNLTLANNESIMKGFSYEEALLLNESLTRLQRNLVDLQEQLGHAPRIS